MNTIKNTRRCFLLTAPLTWLFGVGRRTFQVVANHDITPAALVADHPAGETLEDWLRGAIHDLPYLASGLANMERNSVYEDHAADWPLLAYRNFIPWRPGVVLIFAFGQQREAKSLLETAATWLEQAGIQSLAVGWSHDHRAWTQFVLADRETLIPIITKSVATLSTVDSNL